MGGSLLIAGLIEVIDRDVNDLVRLAADFDFGEGEPDQATIGSLYLDGEAITGERRSNRSMRLPLNVYGTSALDIAARVDAIRQAVNVGAFPTQWTPDGGLPIIFDCFRATAVRVHNPVLDAAGGPAPLLLTFPALPFGRTPGLAAITAAGTVTQLDNFDAARTGATLDTSVKYEGTGSAKIALTRTGTPGAEIYSTATPLAHSYASAVDMTGMNAVSMRIRWPAPGADSTMTFTLTLTSAAGNATIIRQKLFINGGGGWRLVPFPLTGDLGSLNLTAVTGYSLTATSTAIPAGTAPSNLWVDDQRMQPPSSALVTTTHAANLLLPSTVGSARAPANLALAASGGSFTQFLLHSPPGDQDPDAQILTALSSASTDQTVTIAAAAANLRGTFSLVLGGTGTDGLDATVEITVTQKENGVAIGTIWDETHAFPGVGDPGRLFAFSEITLPLFDTPADNTLTSYDIRVQIISGGNRYSELMLLDTKGQTVYTDGISLPGTVLYVDEPGALQSGPGVFVSASDRTAAFSKLIECVLSGGPILLDPGLNKLLAWVDAGVPSVTASYYPRWLDERVL